MTNLLSGRFIRPGQSLVALTALTSLAPARFMVLSQPPAISE